MPELKAGDLAPDFELRNAKDEIVRLSDFRGQRVVLYFYPKDFTSGCTTQACGFRDVYPSVEAKNAVVLGVSPDDATSHTNFIAEHTLPFSLLSDPDHKVIDTYGVWGERTNAEGAKFMGLLRSHFVIDEQGRIIDAQYRVQPTDSVEKALASL